MAPMNAISALLSTASFAAMMVTIFENRSIFMVGDYSGCGVFWCKNMAQGPVVELAADSPATAWYFVGQLLAVLTAAVSLLAAVAHAVVRYPEARYLRYIHLVASVAAFLFCLMIIIAISIDGYSQTGAQTIRLIDHVQLNYGIFMGMLVVVLEAAPFMFLVPVKGKGRDGYDEVE